MGDLSNFKVTCSKLAPTANASIEDSHLMICSSVLVRASDDGDAARLTRAGRIVDQCTTCTCRVGALADLALSMECERKPDDEKRFYIVVYIVVSYTYQWSFEQQLGSDFVRYLHYLLYFIRIYLGLVENELLLLLLW